MEINHEDLLQKTYALTQENNKLIKKLRRGARFGMLFKVLFWAVMIGVPIFMYYTFMQPILQQGMAALDQVQGLSNQVQGIGEQAGATSGQLQGLLNAIPGLDALKQLGQ